jgi:dTDP-4-dehydrorhamnose reductase
VTKLLVTGVNGQVGWELLRSCQPLGEVVGLTREQCDLADPDSIRIAIREHKPDVILNPAAYTAVDQAEKEEVLATRINGEAVGVLAEEATRLGALLIHYSTDYVFDGTKDGAYLPSDQPNPQSAYGRSKLAGEQALQASNADWLCLRTSWVYASRGRNFLKTVLRLAAEREELRIVADQFGAPTSARLIADVTAQVVARAIIEKCEFRFTSGIFHLTATGVTSWHGFASEIVALARRTKLFATLKVAVITPLRSEDYPLPAMRPANSCMDGTSLQKRFGVITPGWKRGVELCTAEIN